MAATVNVEVEVEVEVDLVGGDYLGWSDALNGKGYS
jgi:hypothetical protein